MRAWFSLTLFLGAALLFVVQPMVARMLLPLLGGTTAVWNTCMVFFQALLLLGYAYAHAAPAWLGVRRHAVLHLAVLALPFLALPIRLPAGVPPAESSPVPWLLGALVVAVGLPFFALSAGAPLLQRWFAESGHRERRDPYFLYGASNLGSLVGLLSYPFLIEPTFTLAQQRLAWAVGYGALLVLVAGCAVLLLRARPAAAGAEVEAAPAAVDAAIEPIGRGRRLRWVALAIVPSSLMLGVTSAITTDMAAIPLMWVIPLSLYLLSFIIVFSRPPLILHRLMVMLLPIAIVALALARIFHSSLPILGMIGLHLAAFLVVALACHGELANDRPASGRLTEFYLWLAVGGVLGGALNALAAPLLFDRLVEYPLIAVVACFLNPGASLGRRAAAEGVKGVGAARPAAARGGRGRSRGASAAATSSGRRAGGRGGRRFAWAAFGVVMGLVFLLQSVGGDPRRLLASERDFYGILRVKLDPVHHLVGLVHGTTTHGIESQDPSLRDEPLCYYHRESPIGQLFAAFGGSREKRRIAVVGLGVGTLASYVGPGQAMTFYEIDPAVERIARDTAYFQYLTDAARRGARVAVRLGDARLRLARARERYDLIVLDAFSSDVVPVHLITRQAIAQYLERLEPGGLLAVHISSQYFRLEPVLAELARDAGLACLYQRQEVPLEDQVERGIAPSRWVVMARRPEDLGPLATDARWLTLDADPGSRAWTDDYANVLGAVIWSHDAAARLRAAPGAGLGP